jgi:uncharacterized membrane protein YgcG
VIVQPTTARARGTRLVLWGLAVLGLVTVLGAATAAAAGPPFPAPTNGERVYDTAGILSADTIRQAEATIRDIEARTGAQVVVYTQVKPESNSSERARDDALALMNQWGVGRKGFDDGLVILFDLDQSLRHGQVQLYAGSGFRATFLDDSERQAVYQNDMLPLLRQGDLNGALLVALQRVDASATPAHAQTLERARQVNAVLALLGIVASLLLIVYWAWHWVRLGRDPYYVDDPSILMAGPPERLTPATGALVRDGRSSRRTLTTALLDLASRGQVAFVAETHGKASIDLRTPDPNDPQLARNRVRPLGDAEQQLAAELSSLGDGQGHIAVDVLQRELPSWTGSFDSTLESSAVTLGWFTAAPTHVIRRWMAIGILEIVGGSLGLVAGVLLPSSGLAVAGVSVGIAGAVTAAGAFAMPARTMPGAMVHAMLEAYRRTLQKTLDQSRSMAQVVEARSLPWLETPDQAYLWGTALGLDHEVERVLQRSLEDARAGAPSTSVWFPVWYATGAGGWSSGGPSGPGGVAPGLMAASAIPDVGGMVAAIGSIGSPPPSSSGGGFGGGGGGGGGGAGGGF